MPSHWNANRSAYLRAEPRSVSIRPRLASPRSRPAAIDRAVNVLPAPAVPLSAMRALLPCLVAGTNVNDTGVTPISQGTAHAVQGEIRQHLAAQIGLAREQLGRQHGGLLTGEARSEPTGPQPRVEPPQQRRQDYARVVVGHG